MIPSLYVANETNFDKIGLGMLPDCTSCVVTEERNGVYELEFSYPITGVNYQELSPDRIVKAKPNERSEPQLFRIYRNSKPLNGIVKFYAQHISYDLNTMLVMPFKLKGVPGQSALRRILSSCVTTPNRPNRFTQGYVSVGNGSVNIKEPSPARRCLGGMEGSLLDGFHGEFEFDNFTVNFYQNRGQDTGVTILYGKNLTDITSETSIADTYTSVCPYYMNDDETVNTISNKNIFDGYYYPAPSDTISYRQIAVKSGKYTLFTDMPKRSDNLTNLFLLPGSMTAGASTNTNGVWLGNPRTVTALGGYVTIAYRRGGNISPADYRTVIVDGDLSAVEDRETTIYPTKITRSLIMLDGAENYGSERTLPLDLTEKFGEEEDYSTVKLIEKANAYIRKNDPSKIRQNIELSFAQLWQSEEYKNVALLERVGLCDTVTVKYEALGVSAKAKVIKTVYDVLKEKYIKMELGDVRSNFGATLLKLNENLGDLANTSVNKSAMQRAIENATRLITGAEGGYVYISNRINAKGDILDGIEQNQELEFEDEKPGEILIMDKPDINSANRMWRWNLGGLGYSKNGYNGPYETAITMDGAIVANFITAGELNAGIITTGILKDKYGVNYWNLETGEFRLTTTTKIKGFGYGNEKTLSEYVTEKANSATVSASEANRLAAKFEQEFLEQEKIFNALTDNGRAKGIYLTPDGELYINGTFIKAGSISGNLIRSGVIQSKDGYLTIDLTKNRFSIKSRVAKTSGELDEVSIQPHSIRMYYKNKEYANWSMENVITATGNYCQSSFTTDAINVKEINLLSTLNVPTGSKIKYNNHDLSLINIKDADGMYLFVLGYR